MDGWIKIHRKIFESPAIAKDPEALAVWIYLIVNAAYKPYYAYFNGEKILINQGELITGRKKIAENTGVSESKIFRILKRFKSEQQIEQRPTPNGSLISIKNWTYYQKSEQQNEQRMNNERTTNEQRMNTIKEIKEYKELEEEKENNKQTLNKEQELIIADDLSFTPSVGFYDPINGMNKKAKERLQKLREKIKEVEN